MPTQPSTLAHRGLETQRVQQTILTKGNMVRQATPTRLAQELDGLYTGRLTIARFWEQMQSRDEMIRTVDGKRKDTIEGLDWNIIHLTDAVTPENKKLADEQKEVLGQFYNHITVTDVLFQDRVGGVGLLTRHMMDARAKGWAVHEWIWQPRAIENKWTTGWFRFCPLYWFENTRGRLRFLLSDSEIYGVEMPENEWLVTASEDYMQAVTAGWLTKLDVLRAWVRFCERFGFPIPHGKTSAAKNSEEWNNLVSAIESFNEDAALVTNLDAEILLIEARNTGSQVPFIPLVERIERMIAVTILGADLSTLSAGQGQGQGASLQGREDEKREKSDAAFISEVLNRKVDRAVLEYHFGPGTPILVKFTLVPTKRIDISAELQVAQFAVDRGVPVGVDDFRERFGLTTPPEDAETLRPAISLPTQANPANGQPQGTNAAAGAGVMPGTGEQQAGEIANAITEQDREKLLAAAEQEVATARAEDLQSVARELEIILGIEDPGHMRAALQRWLSGNEARAKRLLAKPGRLAPALLDFLNAAVLNGLQNTPDQKS